MLVQVGVINGHHTLDLHGLYFFAFDDFALRHDASGHIVKGVQGLILDTHGKNQSIIGYNGLIVQYDVLI